MVNYAYLVIPFISLIASCLTLFSGFGLGTILTPTFILFFPVQVAVAMTAVVHLLNNIFKLFLVGNAADKKTVISFGVPAIGSAVIGAFALGSIANLKNMTIFGKEILAIKFSIGILIVIFAILELLPILQKVSFDKKYLPLGGIISGFFGGLSGNQGVFRSAFLMKCNLTKESFIGTGVVIAVLIDFARLIVYGIGFYNSSFSIIDYSSIPLVLTAAIAAFLGAYLGSKILKKITLKSLQYIVAVMMVIIGAGMIFGYI